MYKKILFMLSLIFLLAYVMPFSAPFGVISINTFAVESTESTTETSESYRDKVIKNIKKYCDDHHNANYLKCFKSYASSDDEINLDGLKKLLKDANVGNLFTRGFISKKIMDELDKDKNKKISMSEVTTFFIH